MGKGGEQRLIQVLVSEPAIEAFDEGVLRRLAGTNVMPIDTRFGCPGYDRTRGQLRAIVTAERFGLAMSGDEIIELSSHSFA